MDDNKFWMIIVLGVICGIVVLVLGGMTISNNRYKALIENGYEETTIIGNGFPVWQKVRP